MEMSSKDICAAMTFAIVGRPRRRDVGERRRCALPSLFSVFFFSFAARAVRYVHFVPRAGPDRSASVRECTRDFLRPFMETREVCESVSLARRHIEREKGCGEMKWGAGVNDGGAEGWKGEEEGGGGGAEGEFSVPFASQAAPA